MFSVLRENDPGEFASPAKILAQSACICSFDTLRFFPKKCRSQSSGDFLGPSFISEQWHSLRRGRFHVLLVKSFLLDKALYSSAM